MAGLRVALMLVVLWTAGAPVYAYQAATGASPNTAQVLRSSTDPKALERAAIVFARSGTSSDLEVLSRFLRDPGFLRRLDPDPTRPTLHLVNVMTALGEHPTPQVAELCQTLAEDPAYVTVDERKISLLQILADVRPMSQRTAAFFQSSNEQGYFAFNAHLLTANASPRALTLFETMMLDRETPLEDRVECLHVSVLPHRTELQILQTADRILARSPERGIVLGVVESVFSYRQTWFGIESGIAEPLPWRSTSAESLRYAASLAARILTRPDLPATLRTRVERERGTIVSLLNAQPK